MKKMKKENKTQTIIIAILSVAVIALAGGLIYCATNMKTGTEKEHLAMHKHLLAQYIRSSCKEHNGDKSSPVCQVEKEGISKDGDPYVVYWGQDYDQATHQPKGAKEYGTLYFQHSATAADGFSEAFSYDVPR